jgi:hypothetical protein
VTSSETKLALYLAGLSEAGKTLDGAASALRRKPATIKRLCRRWMIPLADYQPFARAKTKPEPVGRLH